MPTKKRNACRNVSEGDIAVVSNVVGEGQRGGARPRGDPGINDAQPPSSRARVKVPEAPEWTLHSTVESVLRRRIYSPVNVKLNDFLRKNLGGRGVETSNDNVGIEMFVVAPEVYIQDEELVADLYAMPSFKTLLEDNKAWKRQIVLNDAVHKLKYAGVYSLRQWDEYDEKEHVIPLVRGMLNTALIIAKNSYPVQRGLALVGMYESVFNATWSHVVNIPGDSEGVGMEVRVGKPSREWKDSEVDYALPGTVCENAKSISAEGVADPQETRVELIVLNSERGWPYTWLKGRDMYDCHIGPETERAWRIIKLDINDMVETCGRSARKSHNCILLGTPGIGKSMGTGSYLLYQLLHYDKERLPAVAYFIGNKVFIFDKTRGEDERHVEYYENFEDGKSAVRHLSMRVRGYIIYDVPQQGDEPPHALPHNAWGMIVVTSPARQNFEGWKEQRGGRWIIINCPSVRELKARCVWMNRNKPKEDQQKEWKAIEERIIHLGPIPRYIFTHLDYRSRLSVAEAAMRTISASNASWLVGVRHPYAWNNERQCHRLVKAVRLAPNGFTDNYRNEPLTTAAKEKVDGFLGDATDSRPLPTRVLLPF